MGTDLQARSEAVATSKCSVGPVAFRPAEPLPACGGASRAAQPSRSSERREHASSVGGIPSIPMLSIQGDGDKNSGGASASAARAGPGADRRRRRTVEMPRAGDTGAGAQRPRSGVEKDAAKRLRKVFVHRMKEDQKEVESLTNFLEGVLTRSRPRKMPCLRSRNLRPSSLRD